MLISRVEVENFRSIVRGKAVITEGINFIHGPNGSGKTSLLEAIAMGLYGSDWVRGRYKLSDLVRKGASTALIRIELVGLDGRKYLIQRAFTTEKSIEFQTYVINEEGRRVAARDREVTQFVTNITGINMETFSELLYVRQGEIRDILRSGKKGEFRFDTLLRLDSIERARQDVVREGLKRVEITIEGLRGKISVISNELQLRINERDKLLNELNRINNELSKLEDELSRVNREIETLKSQEEELSSAEREYLAVKQELELINKQLNELTEALESTRRNYEELSKLMSRLEDEEGIIKEEEKLKERLREMERRRDEVRDLLSSMEERKSRAESLNKELKEINTRITELSNELERLGELRNRWRELKDKVMIRDRVETEIETAREETARLKAEIEHIDLEIKLLNETGDKCPVCGRPLSREMASELRAQRTARLNALIKRLNELNNQLTNLTTALNQIRRYEEELREIESELSREDVIKRELQDLMNRRASITSELSELSSLKDAELRRELQSIEEEISKVNNSIRELENKRIEIAEIRGRLRGLREIEENMRNLEARIRELTNRKSELGRRMGELEGKLKNLTAIREKLSAEVNERERLISMINELRGRAQTLGSRIAELNGEIESKNNELNKLRSEVNKYNNAAELLTRIQDTLDSVKPMVRKLFLDAVNGELTEMAREIMHKGSYSSVEINEDYEVMVRRSDGVVLPVDSLSIGERNLVSLFLRYAIARAIMGSIPILILDEPTEHLDEEHRRRIAMWIRSLSNGVRSVIITSHVDSLETIADNIIRIGFINNRGESAFYNA
ncbi:AAA family ATPase [Vulcanisaeta thermophila]|uniref:AAA family ATPase n=1 Tax=Vulcanisaeta thermophila TaxID=867917 RepID=UPI0008528F5A|nr:AAA family ATPase [Vulcanisaeta thermophila]